MTISADPGVERVQRFWEARAREDADRYSIPFGGGPQEDGEFRASGEDLLDVVADRTGWDAAGADVVLDLGCGAGRLTEPLAERVGEVLSVDVSPTMVAAGRARHPDLDNVRWEVGHAGGVPGAAGASVDDVVLLGVLPHLPTLAMVVDALGEAARVLRGDGGLLFDVRDAPGPLALPGEGAVPARVSGHPLWRGVVVDLETLAASASQHGLLIERIDGSGTGRCLVLARRERA